MCSCQTQKGISKTTFAILLNKKNWKICEIEPNVWFTQLGLEPEHKQKTCQNLWSTPGRSPRRVTFYPRMPVSTNLIKTERMFIRSITKSSQGWCTFGCLHSSLLLFLFLLPEFRVRNNSIVRKPYHFPWIQASQSYQKLYALGGAP